MKKIYFLAGLPRAGNTLLASIINQNPKVTMTGNSVLCSIVYGIHQLKEDPLYQNFPDETALDNVISKAFQNFYEHYEADVIFDRSAWGTPVNLPILRKYIEDPKFLILNRSMDEVVASFVKSKKKESKHATGVEEIISKLFDAQRGKLTMDIWSVRNILEQKMPYLKIEYDDLVANTKAAIDEIYRFFELEPFEHQLEDFNQLTINGNKYDDSCLDFNLHTIRTGKIEKNKYDVRDILPVEILKQLQKINFVWT